MPRPLFCRDGCWDPFEKGQMNLFDQNTGFPCFLEPDEISWIDLAKKRLTASWTGSLCSPLFNSLRMEIPPTCIGAQGQISDATCEQTEQNWKVCLNVNPYSREEISIKTKEGYLAITGERMSLFDQDYAIDFP